MFDFLFRASRCMPSSITKWNAVTSETLPIRDQPFPDSRRKSRLLVSRRCCPELRTAPGRKPEPFHRYQPAPGRTLFWKRGLGMCALNGVLRSGSELLASNVALWQPRGWVEFVGCLRCFWRLAISALFCSDRFGFGSAGAVNRRPPGQPTRPDITERVHCWPFLTRSPAEIKTRWIVRSASAEPANVIFRHPLLAIPTRILLHGIHPVRSDVASGVIKTCEVGRSPARNSATVKLRSRLLAKTP